MFKTRATAFTLIELLVVIVIIVVLAAILWPPQFGDREKARPATCVSNLKQLTLALIQYNQDNDQTYPRRQTTDRSGRVSSWRTAISPYLKSKDCYKCPSNPMHDASDIEHDGLKRSYAVNSSNGGLDDIGGPFSDNRPRTTLASILHPASTILLVESTAAYNDFNPLLPDVFTQTPDERQSAGHMFSGHNDRSMFAFADGHVKSYNPMLTIGASDEQPVNMWTIDNSPYSLDDRKTAQYVLGYAVEQGKK